MKGGINGVTTVGLGAQNDVRRGGQVQRRARLQLVQLPAQRSNSIGPATVAGWRRCRLSTPPTVLRMMTMR